jgi:uncharacterized protein (TIGR00304 family)
VVIIPIIEGTGVYSFFGILLIIAGIIFLMLSFVGSSFELVGFDELEMKSSPKPYPTATTSKDDRNKRLKDYRTRDGRERSPRPEYRPEQRSERKTSVKTGGVVFIGPVPIIWGSDKKIAYIMALVSVARIKKSRT